VLFPQRKLQLCDAGIAYLGEVICAGEDVELVTKPQPSPTNTKPESAPRLLVLQFAALFLLLLYGVILRT